VAKDQSSIPASKGNITRLSELAQKAVWASKIIKMISESEAPTSIKESLRDKIINMKIDTTPYGFELD
jgi:hypothetical protein